MQNPKFFDFPKGNSEQFREVQSALSSYKGSKIDREENLKNVEEKVDKIIRSKLQNFAKQEMNVKKSISSISHNFAEKGDRFTDHKKHMIEHLKERNSISK